jgi:hypothetical protein
MCFQQKRKTKFSTIFVPIELKTTYCFIYQKYMLEIFVSCATKLLIFKQSRLKLLYIPTQAPIQAPAPIQALEESAPDCEYTMHPSLRKFC